MEGESVSAGQLPRDEPGVEKLDNGESEYGDGSFSSLG